jgi:hypothetical protein
VALFTDDFNRTSLGPNWTELHLDGSGSVSVDGAAVTIDAGGSGDFGGTADGGSLIYRAIPVSSDPLKVARVTCEVTVTTTGLPDWARLLMLRASAAADAAFVSICKRSTGKIGWVYRAEAGAAAVDAGDSGVTYNPAQPLRIRFISYEKSVELWTSQDGGTTWGFIAYTGVSETLALVGLTDSLHTGAVSYDDFSADDSLVDVTPRFTAPTENPFILQPVAVETYALTLRFTGPAPAAPEAPAEDWSGPGRIAGSVAVEGAPAARKVRLFEAVSGVLVRETWSDPLTGAYEFSGIDPANEYVVLVHDHTRTYNALVQDAVAPEAL